MKPVSLTVYVSPEERRYVRRVALEAGISASQLVRLAALLVVRKADKALSQGVPPETIIGNLRRNAGEEG